MYGRNQDFQDKRIFMILKYTFYELEEIHC